MLNLTDAAIRLRTEQERWLSSEFHGTPCSVEDFFEGLYFTKIDKTIEGEIRVLAEVLYSGPLPLAVRNDSGMTYVYIETEGIPLKFPVGLSRFSKDEMFSGVFI